MAVTVQMPGTVMAMIPALDRVVTEHDPLFTPGRRRLHRDLLVIGGRSEKRLVLRLAEFFVVVAEDQMDLTVQSADDLSDSSPKRNVSEMKNHTTRLHDVVPPFDESFVVRLDAGERPVRVRKNPAMPVMGVRRKEDLIGPHD
jgi:hypothetical protein